jgi:hypothetical protein
MAVDMPDVCRPDLEDPDLCDGTEGGHEDECLPPQAEPDECAQDGGADICEAPDPDVCVPGQETDDCKPGVGDVDFACADGDSCTSTDPDLCVPGVEPDVCGQIEPDLCAPPADPDEAVDEDIARFVPEPGSMGLLASGLVGLAGYAALRWRSKGETEE